MTLAAPLEDIGERKLRILHVLRAPLGGLFRHVMDLTQEQIRRGHAVGLVTDSSTGGERAADILRKLEPHLALGLFRLPIARQPHPSDVVAAFRIALHCHRLAPDVVHGHGSKGGFYARLPGFLSGGPVRAYTPHGGSFNYRGSALEMASFMAVERLLASATDVFLFESAYIHRCFCYRLGEPKALAKIVLNGITHAEFIPAGRNLDAADFLYVGELRAAKGIDTLIEALALVAARRPSELSRPRLVLVGTGLEQDKLAAFARDCGVADLVTFVGQLPAREAFRLGRILVVPSRAESLPYIVLEAAAAQVPMVATDVGGIGEIFGPYCGRLIACNDPEVLARKLSATLAQTEAERHSEAVDLAAFVAAKFTVAGMVDAVLAGYAEAIARRQGGHRRVAPSFALPS